MADHAYVFIVKGDSPVVLHPFEPGSPVFSRPGDISILGRYGAGEAPGNVPSVRSELHGAMEKGARRHFLEKGYYLRLAMTTATFIVVYLFFSIVVRDPLPLIDELLLGGFAAAAVFYASERRALSSPRHLDALVSLRQALDGAYFSESRVVDLVESWRDEAIALGPAAYYKAADPSLSSVALSPDETAEATELCALLSRRWRSKPIVAELYALSRKGSPAGQLLDKADRRLGRAEASLCIAYIKLLSLVPTGEL